MAKNVYLLTSCHSTNESASELVKKGAATEGDIVITDNQLSGKGQRGNSWEAEPGKNLTFSLILRPKFLTPSRQFDLNMAVSIGILNYLKKQATDFFVKWPNDIYYGSQKVCGILIQNSIKTNYLDHSVIGIGLNINQHKFKEDRAISLSQIHDQQYDLNQELGKLLTHIEAAYLRLRNGSVKSIKDQYLENMLGFCEDRIFREGDEVFKGRIVGISQEGKLEIESPKGLRYFGFKEIEFL